MWRAHLTAGLLIAHLVLPPADLAASEPMAGPPGGDRPTSRSAATHAPRLSVEGTSTGVGGGADFEVRSRRPHDTGAFTEGLVMDGQGRLFESTGLYGRSRLREVDPASGRVLREVALPDDRFGEGLAIVGDRLVQLTWRSGRALVWDLDTFEPLGELDYEGEGWGLCFDGQRLVMSDGSDRLTFRDPDTFAVLGRVAVTRDGTPLTRLNELECVDGQVWANVWYQDDIVRIDPADGRVTAALDLSGLVVPDPAEADPGDVLNGIAYDAASDTFLVTGKRWPQLVELRLRELSASPAPEGSSRS